MIKIIYFSSIRELLGCDAEEFELPQTITVNNLKNKLISRGLPWSTALSGTSLMVAINQEVTSSDQLINKGDEIAFFPPVTGG